MKLSDLFARTSSFLSFELFPPKTEAGIQNLMKTVEELIELQPDFFTCTYGAGGSTRDKTLAIASQIRKQHNIPVASHLTCVQSTIDQLRSYLQASADAGIDYIVALRGDPPKGQENFEVTEGGLRYANELVELIETEFSQLGILVAGYPEVHQEAPSADIDMENLVRKVDAGADAVVTQLFYDNEDFFRFRDSCEKAGIKVPIVPGLLPVINLKQVTRIASLCKAKLPSDFVSKLEADDKPESQFQVGVDHAIAQTQGLLDAGIPGIHFYVLNRSDAIQQIMSNVTGLDR